MPLPKYVFRVSSRGRDYYYFQHRRGYPDAGPRIALPDPTDPTWHAAVAAAIADKAAPSGDTLGTVWEAYLAGPRGPKTDGTRKAYTAAWRVLAQVWGDQHPRKITPVLVGKLHDGMADRANMANMVLVVLRNVLGEAKRLGMVDTNAADGIRPHKLTDVDGAKPLTPEAWAALMAPECPRPVYRLAILGRAIGQRISDLVTLCPAMRDGDGFRHRIRKRDRARKGAPFWSRIEADYLPIIDGWKGFPRTPYVHCDGRKGDARLRQIWNEYAATKAGKALAGFTPHDLRATNYCDHVLAGMTPDDIARLRCTSVKEVLAYTQHLKPQDFAEALKNRRVGA